MQWSYSNRWNLIAESIISICCNIPIHNKMKIDTSNIYTIIVVHILPSIWCVRRLLKSSLYFFFFYVISNPSNNHIYAQHASTKSRSFLSPSCFPETVVLNLDRGMKSIWEKFSWVFFFKLFKIYILTNTQ